MKSSERIRFVLTLTLLAIVLHGVAGCRTSEVPRPVLDDPEPSPYYQPRIAVLTSELQSWIRFDPAEVVDDDDRPMQVEVPVRNVTNRQYLIDYRFQFYDKTGSELKPVMGWRMTSFEPKQAKRLKAKALSTDATDYRLEVRWAR